MSSVIKFTPHYWTDQNTETYSTYTMIKAFV